MTNNQIAYQVHLETQRHNIVNETISWSQLAEAHRHNTVVESQGWASIEETHRHNVVVEGETERHNRMTESIGWGQLAETTRHNKAQESIGWGNIALGYANLAEQKRRNDMNYFQWANEYQMEQKQLDYKYWSTEYEYTQKRLMAADELSYKYDALHADTGLRMWSNLNDSVKAISGLWTGITHAQVESNESWMKSIDWARSFLGDYEFFK